MGPGRSRRRAGGWAHPLQGPRDRGIGWILGQAINQRDYPVVQGVFLVITVSVVAANLLADLVYSKLDPRIRIQG